MSEYSCHRLRVYDAMPRGVWVTTNTLTELTFPDKNQREKNILKGEVYRCLTRLHKWGEVEKRKDYEEGIMWRRSQ